jgi:hypothetical protein
LWVIFSLLDSDPYCKSGSGYGSRDHVESGSTTLVVSAFPPVLRIRDVYPGSRILIFTHPGSRISDPGSRISDPKTATKERGEKNFFSNLFLLPQIAQNYKLFYF